MKEIKIKKLDDSEVTVRIRQPTGEQVKKIRNKLAEVHKKAKAEKEIDGLNEFLEFQDKVTCECAYMDNKNIDMKFLDSLEQDQKEKLTSIVGVAALGELNFTKLLGKQLN